MYYCSCSSLNEQRSGCIMQEFFLNFRTRFGALCSGVGSGVHGAPGAGAPQDE